jgi:hypothetical protein
MIEDPLQRERRQQLGVTFEAARKLAADDLTEVGLEYDRDDKEWYYGAISLSAKR